MSDVRDDQQDAIPTPRLGLRVLATRMARFAFVGGVGAVLNLSLLTLLVEVAGWHYLLAAAVAIELSTVNNYLVNRIWTWGDRDRTWWSLLSYHGVVLVGLLLQFLVLTLGVSLLGVHYLVAAVVGIAAGTGWNFLANHRFTFQHYGPERRARHLRVALYAAALVVHLGVAAFLAHDWDTFVFQRSTEQFLAEGTTPYDVGLENPDYVYWGVGTPVEPWWYAYPPLPLLVMSVSYAPVVFGSVAAPWAARLLIKAPFIVSTLVFAGVASHLVRTAPGVNAERNARRLEAFILFNPIFILVASLWGQFESLLLVLLALSFLALRSNRQVTAGVFFGLATLVKIFPLYLAPVLGLYLLRRTGLRSAVRYFAAGAAVFVTVSLPFFLLQPEGFLQQVFLMHRDRAPGRFAPFAFLYHTLRWFGREFPETLPSDEILVRTISLASFTLTSMILLTLAAGSWATRPTERGLLAWCGVSLLGGLMVTKLFSEQYLLLPLGLLALAALHPGALPAGFREAWAKRFLLGASLFVAIIAFTDSALFLVFVPEDVARFLFGQTVHETIRDVAAFFGLTVIQFRAIIGAVGGTGLLVPLYCALRLLGPPIAAGFHVVVHAIHRHPITRRPILPARLVRAALAVGLAALLLPAVSLAALAPRMEAPPDTAGTVDSESLVIAHYRSDWFNPVVRPDVRAGTWATSNLTPAAGYYNAIPHKVGEDLELVRAAGVDALLVSFHPAFEHQAGGVANVAHQAAMPYAMELDLRHLADDAGRVALTRATANAARELFDGPGFEYWRDSYHLRLGDAQRRVVFIAGAADVGPTFSDAERRFVAEVAQETTPPARVAALRDEAPFWTKSPTSSADLQGDSESAKYWRAAYEQARRVWWDTMFSSVPTTALEGFSLVVDDPTSVWLPATRPLDILGSYVPVRASAAGAAPWSPLVATVDAPAKDAPAFRGALAQASAREAPILLVPWNDFDLGQAVEPTLEHGDGLFRALLAWDAEPAEPRA